MKKLLFTLAAAACMAACTPTTTPSTTGTDTTKVDSLPVVVQDTQPVVDTAASGLADVNTDGSAGGDPNGKPTTTEPSTGRVPNPNVDLNVKRYDVSGRFLVKSPYCGGAAPTPDIIAAAETPQPLASTGFIIRKGKTNAVGTAIETRVTTDNQGVFRVSLPAGTYCMVLNEKENRRTPEFLGTQYYEIDKKCDDKWLSTCDVSFTVVDKNVSGLRVTLERKCYIQSFSTCIQWGGPLPPSTAPRRDQ